MALTRAQLLSGDGSQGVVLAGQVQGVTAGTGVTISPTGALSINTADPAFNAFIRTNAVGAFNSYIWPAAAGTVGQQLTLGAGNALVWSDSDGIPWTALGQLIVGTGVGTDVLLNAGADGSVLRANSSTASGLEWVVAPPAVIVSATAPAAPEDGQLWYDCNTGYLKIYQSCVTPAGWADVSEPGLPVDPAATSAAPPFVSGTGVTADPYICNVSTAFIGSSVFVVNTVTVTGLAPNQFVPIVDLAALTNGGRFSFSNNYADAAGTLTFQTIFTDLPPSAPLTSYTAQIRVGYASSYIEAVVDVIEVLSVTSGTISGNPNDGATLLYTPGVVSGGVAPTSTTWVWLRESDGTQVTGTNPDDLTITVPNDCVGDRIYVQITATDSLSPTPQTATADTALFPLPPNTIGPAFSITSAGSIAGTANVGQTLTYTQGTYTGGTAPVVESWVWYRESDNSVVTGTNPDDLTITIPADCSGDRVYVKYTVTDSSAPPITLSQDTAFFPASPSVITGGVFPGLIFDPTVGPTASPASVNANGLKGTATATWPATPATTSLTATGDLQFTVNNVGPAGQGPTTVNTNDTVELIWDPGAISAAADNATLTGTLTDGVYTNTFSFTVDRSPDPIAFTDLLDKPLSSAAQSNVITPVGFNVPISVAVAGTGTDPLTSEGISISGSAFGASPQPFIPGDTIRLQGTTGPNYSTPYGLDVSVGSGPVVTDTWTVTTIANVPVVNQPTITAPSNGATGINPATNTPAATVTVTGSAYDPLNGAAGQQSADWEVYKGSYPLTSTNTITNVAQNGPGPWSALPTNTTSTINQPVVGLDGVLVAVTGTTIIRSTDRGATWSTMFTRTNNRTLLYVATDGAGTWIVSGGEGTVGTTPYLGYVLRSRDNGLTWTNISTSGGLSGIIQPSDGALVAIWSRADYLNGQWSLWEWDGNITVSRHYVSTNATTWTSVSGARVNIRGGWYFPSVGLYFIGQFGQASAPVSTPTQGRLYSSSDNRTYTSRYSFGSANGDGPRGMAISTSGLLVAVGNNGKIITSTDGIAWTLQTSGTTQDLTDVDFLDGKFIVSGLAGTILVSTDGITWTSQVSGTTNNLQGIYNYGATVYASGNSGTIRTAPISSTTLTIADCQSDGFLVGDTVEASPSAANAGPADILSLNNTTVTVAPAGTGWAIGQNITRTTSQTLLSTNAITAVGSIPAWVARVSGSAATSDFRYATYSSTGVTITGSTGQTGGVIRSTDNGLTWTATSLTWSGGRATRGIPTDNSGKWLIGTGTNGTSATGTSFKSLDDGLTWVASGATIPAGYAITGLSYIGTKWTLWMNDSSTTTSTRRISTNGMATWSTTSGVYATYSHNYVSAWSLYVITTGRTSVGGTAAVRTSPDDATYTARYTHPGTGEQFMWTFAYGNGVGVAVGSSGVIAYSTDGITWTEAESGTTQDLYGITFSNNTFTACGDNGTILVSLDGINWVTSSTGTTGRLLGITSTPTNLITSGDNNTILTSTPAQSYVAIAGTQTDGFEAGNEVTSSPSGAGPSTITFLNNTNAILFPYSASWAVGQKFDRTTEYIKQVVPPPANPNTTNLTSINIPQVSLLPSTKYWARVRYTSSDPVTSLWSPWSSFTTASSFVPAIGAPLGGGFYAGQIQVFAGEEGGGLPVVDTIYNLIVAPRVGDNTGPNPAGTLQGAFGGATDSTVAYKTASSADSPSTVATNTVYGGTATALFGDAAHPAFNWAKNTGTGPNAGVYDPTNVAGTGIGGYNDWYIPAESELEILYRNLKPTTANNVTTTGINPNAVPPSTTNYTTTNPAQVTVAAFQAPAGAQVMGSASPTLSSTEVAATPANRVSITFTTGARTSATKVTVGFARAIRREEA